MTNCQTADDRPVNIYVCSLGNRSSSTRICKQSNKRKIMTSLADILLHVLTSILCREQHR